MFYVFLVSVSYSCYVQQVLKYEKVFKNNIQNLKIDIIKSQGLKAKVS